MTDLVYAPPLHAGMFSKETQGGHLFFGINRDNAEQALRLLADAIRDDTVLVQEVNVRTVATNDDFLMTHLTFVVVQKGTVLL